MKEKLLKLLVCPSCGRGFRCRIFSRRGGEVEDGLLTCRCGKWYPIVGFIPRILPNIIREHPGFLDKYRDKIPRELVSRKELKEFAKTRRSTKESFGLQWTRYKYLRSEQDMEYVRQGGFKPGSLRGKIVLDAGCGYGRHMSILSKHAKEIVGVDLGEGVNSAQELLGKRKNVHLIQGDLLNLPFRKGAFDFIYSWGVIHHTPHPKKTFENIAQYVKPKGGFSVKIYSRRHPGAEFLEYFFRWFTTKLPHRLLYFLCYIAAPLGPLFSWFRTKPILGYIPSLIPIVYYPDWRRSHIDTFDRFSPQYQYHYSEEEVVGWFNETGFTDIIASGDHGIRGTLKKFRPLPEARDYKRGKLTRKDLKIARSM